MSARDARSRTGSFIEYFAEMKCAAPLGGTLKIILFPACAVFNGSPAKRPADSITPQDTILTG
jgi:hypothetical protein